MTHNDHKRVGGLNNKLTSQRHTNCAKSTPHRIEKRVETKVRQAGKKACQGD